MVDLNPSTFIITLNVNGEYSHERQRFSDWKKIEEDPKCCLQETLLYLKMQIGLE